MISPPHTIRLALPQRSCVFVRCVRAQQHVQARHLSGLAQSYHIPTREEKVVIFSGIQPTGIPHLGNYLGALEPWAQLQDAVHPESTLLFSLVDLHALSKMNAAEQRRQSRRETLAAMLASGLDPKRSIIFRQSAVRDSNAGHHLRTLVGRLLMNRNRSTGQRAHRITLDPQLCITCGVIATHARMESK